ncbi:hypothetical protein EJ02DRAFT_264756 [Clathrospora elynae]|uniref:Uncharacterized protein n=1 Tax=Clathrospora elynae TaxID=706981 RepID=A0A6A5SF11_9PLEO|nr:hypothetical protein EJ02DRAFT_264756 [Clathrospora elynae]
MQSKVIIAASVLLGICFIIVMALVTRFFLPKQTKQSQPDDMYIANGSAERQGQLAQISSSWKRLFTAKQDQNKGHWVPTLAGIIKAGDEGLFSSALFTNLHGHPGDLPLDALYEAFANELRAQPLAERASYSPEVTRFLAGRKRPAAAGLGRSKSVLSHKAANNKRPETNAKTQRKSLDLSAMEMGLSRGISIKKPVQALVPMRNGLQYERKQKARRGSWMKNGQTVKNQGGPINVPITSAELAALSIILGSQLDITTGNQDASCEQGAHGISIARAPTEDCKHRITLQQHKRNKAQQHAQGSGVSPLYAKHLAAGSLPYSQDTNGINSILITEETLESIQAGASLYTHPSTVRTPQSIFLASLPSSRELHFHILAASTQVHIPTTLLDAIAALPFSSGLPPLASAPLINTVRFIASAGLPPARLLQRLEGLVDKVHRHSPHLDIFGPLYEAQNAGLLFRERERLGKLATHPGLADRLADKTARMSRYITLLQRLIALVPDIKSSENARAAVQEATQLQLRSAYALAVAAHASPPLVESEERGTKHAPHPHLRSNRSSDVSTSSMASSNAFPANNLGKQIEAVLKSELPLPLETVAFVARMVLVAWTLSLQSVAWGEGEDESAFRVPGLEGTGEKTVVLG